MRRFQRLQNSHQGCWRRKWLNWKARQLRKRGKVRKRRKGCLKGTTKSETSDQGDFKSIQGFAHHFGVRDSSKTLLKSKTLTWKNNRIQSHFYNCWSQKAMSNHNQLNGAINVECNLIIYFAPRRNERNMVVQCSSCLLRSPTHHPIFFNHRHQLSKKLQQESCSLHSFKLLLWENEYSSKPL